MTIPKTKLLALLTVLVLPVLLAACGGGSDADSDPRELLEQTFGGGEEVSSGVLDISVEASAAGGGGGSLTGALSGPFETRAEDELPLVDMEASLQVQGGGRDTDFDGGLTITEDSAYVTSGGQAYEVDSATFSTFGELFAQSAAAQEGESEEGSAVLEQLGIDPATWLTDVTNEGLEEVGGAETVHISGTADVAQIVEDAQSIDPTGQALGAAGSEALAESVSAASVDVYTGVEDNILRRLDLALEIDDPEGNGGTVSVALSIAISEVNEDVSIEAPADAQPLEELIPGGLGAIGPGLPGLGGSGGGSGSGSGSGGDAGGLGGFGPEYQECVSTARTREDFEACNELLQ